MAYICTNNPQSDCKWEASHNEQRVCLYGSACSYKIAERTINRMRYTPLEKDVLLLLIKGARNSVLSDKTGFSKSYISQVQHGASAASVSLMNAVYKCFMLPLKEKGGVPVKITIRYGKWTEEVDVSEGDTVDIVPPNNTLDVTIIPAYKPVKKAPSAPAAIAKKIAKVVEPDSFGPQFKQVS